MAYKEYTGEVIPAKAEYTEYTGEVVPMEGDAPKPAGGGRGSVNPPAGSPPLALADAQPAPAAKSRAQRIAEMDAVTDLSNPDYSPLTDTAANALRTDARGGMDAKRTKFPGRVLDKDVPPLTASSAAQDLASGALQIVPTAVEGVGQIARMVTGDNYGKGITDATGKINKAIRERVSSDRGKAQAMRLEQDMADAALTPADYVVGNPGALADQALPSLGSMALPIGAAAAAGRVAQAGNAAKLAGAIDPAFMAARVGTAQNAAVLGSTMAQNAASTYTELADKGLDQEQRYLGAALTLPFTYVAGRLTGGGAEGAIARGVAGKSFGAPVKATVGAIGREAGQEGGEQAGSYLGETVGAGEEFDANKAGKQIGGAAFVGGLMGAGTHAGGAAVQALKRETQIKQMRDSGETEVADILQKKHELATAVESVDGELDRMPDARPEFQGHYRNLRTAGVKPTEAAARAAMTTAFGDVAATSGMNEKAAAAVMQKASTLPIDQVPEFIDKATNALAKRGLAQPFDGMNQLGSEIAMHRDESMQAVMDRVYSDAPPTADILKMEQNQAVEPAIQQENAINYDGTTDQIPGITEVAEQPAAETAPPDTGSIEIGAAPEVQPAADGPIAAPDSAEQRDTTLSVGRTGTPSKSGGRARSQSFDRNPLMAFVAKHGLFHDKTQPNSLKSEFSPDKGIMVPGYGPVFRKTGKNIDLLTQDAIEEGYLPTDGTPNQLYDLISRAVAGEKISPLYAEGVAEAEAQRLVNERQSLEDDAHIGDNHEGTFGVGDENAAANSLSELSDDALFELDDSIALTAKSNVSLESAMRSMGFTDQEIQNAATQEQARAREDSQGRSGPDEVAPAQAPPDTGQRDAQAPPPTGRISPDKSTQTPANAGVSTSGFKTELRPSGTLAVKGNATAIEETLKAAGITKMTPMDGGVMVPKPQAQKALAALEGRPAEAVAPKALSIGMTPATAEAVTVKDGTVYIGKNEAINFDTGEPVTVPSGTTDAQIVQALRDAGTLSRNAKVFGLKDSTSGAEPNQSRNDEKPDDVQHLVALRKELSVLKSIRKCLGA